jgi:hypothetical protein
VIFNSYDTTRDIEDCTFQSWTEKWSGEQNGKYGFDNGSLFKQEI